jgi:hypothetical protein
MIIQDATRKLYGLLSAAFTPAEALPSDEALWRARLKFEDESVGYLYSSWPMRKIGLAAKGSTQRKRRKTRAGAI